MRHRLGAIAALLAAVVVAAARPGAPAPDPAPAGGREIAAPPAVLPPRARVEPTNRILRERLEELLPALMREAGLDCWLVISREYVEDPVYFTLVPEPAFSARRTTILAFFDRGPELGVERVTISRYPLGELYSSAWDGGARGADDDQWTRLRDVVAERDPRRIGIDVSPNWALADGLTAALRDRLAGALGPTLAARLVPAERLVVRWLETRTPAELEVWPRAVAVARGVIAEAFSSRVVTPGVTTTEDVAWYVRERFESLGVAPWFQPYVDVQRHGSNTDPAAVFYGLEDQVIRRGDVLHTDVGICYLRLCTDTQEMGYVLGEGEDEVPGGLVRALAVGNRWQDLLAAEFVAGRSGNEILAAARAAAEREGIVSSVYSHPLGYFGHAAGPTIGMWDNQGATPVEGDWTLRPSTGYAIEGNVRVPVPEWDGEPVQIKLEQSAVFDGRRVVYLAGRQTRWHVVR